MRRLELFKIIGESYAQTQPKLAVSSVDYRIAEAYFIVIANNIYPHNHSRHEWALANMKMFHQMEYERI